MNNDLLRTSSKTSRRHKTTNATKERLQLAQLIEDEEKGQAVKN